MYNIHTDALKESSMDAELYSALLCKLIWYIILNPAVFHGLIWPHIIFQGDGVVFYKCQAIK